MLRGDESQPPAVPMTVADLLGVHVAPSVLIETLREVIDPELGVNIVDLGLVYDAAMVDGQARILLTTTTPACPLGTYLSDAIRWALLNVDGVLDVDITVTYDPPWAPERMSEVARTLLGWMS
jgi:metal-sulfur cluster biosynthetic enzyme